VEGVAVGLEVVAACGGGGKGLALGGWLEGRLG